MKSAGLQFLLKTLPLLRFTRARTQLIQARPLCALSSKICVTETFGKRTISSNIQTPCKHFPHSKIYNDTALLSPILFQSLLSHCSHRVKYVKNFIISTNINCDRQISSTAIIHNNTDELSQTSQRNATNQDKGSCSRKQSKASKNRRKSTKHLNKLLPHLFSDDGKSLPQVTVEKQLLGLMQMWEMEEAVMLLMQSVQDGVEPDRTVVLNLLQQLANLGEVECLLELHEFLQDCGLLTNLKFYHCLRDAYFNSGRLDEGFLMLRIIYHSRRDFDDTDLFFTLLATLTAQHFEHMLPLVESYVADLEESDPPVTAVRASFWRCLVLAQKFDLADRLLAEHQGLSRMVPAQVTKLVQSKLDVDYNRGVVLPWLMELPQVKPRLAATLFDMLILHKSDHGEWGEGLAYLSRAMEEGQPIHKKTVENFLSRFLGQLSQDQVNKLSVWSAGLVDLPEDQD